MPHGTRHTYVRCLVALVAAMASSAALAAGAGAETVSLTDQGEHAFVVPSGVYELIGVTAIAGAGGNGSGTGGGAGGRGARVTVPAMTVFPGETLYLEVGANGTHGSVAKGGAGFDGAGSGGTASGICSAGGCAGNSSVLVMAGAGGGGGTIGGGGEKGSGGTGGDAGTSPDGSGTAGSPGGTAGAGGNLIAAAGGGSGRPEHVGGGGANGRLAGFECGGGESNQGGESGSGVNGGNGATTQYDAGNGGGGGGGYDGGGGGGAGAFATCPGVEYTGGGGGGGAGGSYARASGTIETAAVGATPSLSFEYTPGPSRATTISVETQEPTLEVGGFLPMTVTATVEGAAGEGVPGDEVSFTSSDPNVQIGAVTDHGDGTYSTQIRSSDLAGPVTLTATDSSTAPALSAETGYLQTAGFPSDVELKLSPFTVVADGTSTSTATGTVVDEFGNPIEEGGDHVEFAGSDHDDGFTPITDHGNGEYTVTITASTTAGTPTIYFADVTYGYIDEAELTQTPGAAASLGLGLTEARIAADGTATTTAVATLTDIFGNTISGAPVVFSSSDPGQRIGEVRAKGNGTYLVTITASRTAGPATITATDTGTTVSGTTVLTSTPGPPATLALALSPPSIAADGTATSVATVTLADADGNRASGSGDAVTIASSNPGESIGPVTDNHDGTYTATITASRTAGDWTITATDTSRPGLSGTATLTETSPAGSGGGSGDKGGSGSGLGSGPGGRLGAQWIESISLGQKAVGRGKPVGLKVKLASASPVTIYLQRRVPASVRDGHQVKAHYVSVSRVTLPGQAGANTFELATRYQGRELRQGTYRVTVLAGETVRRRNFRITAG